MRVVCRDCGAEIRAEDMSLDNLVARCQACNAAFSFAADVSASSGGGAAGGDRPRDKVPLPRGISVDDASGTLASLRHPGGSGERDGAARVHPRPHGGRR